jgi:hypothetical protein
MGLASVPFPGKTYLQAFGRTIKQQYPDGQDQGVGDAVAKQAGFGAIFLTSRGSALAAGPASVWYPDFPSKANIVFDRLCVQLTVAGNTYDLDPSYKTYEKITSTVDLMAAAGYNRATLLSTAGGASSTADYAVGLSQSNVTNYLNTLSGTLLGQMGTTYSNSTVAQLVNGRRIVKRDIVNLSDAFPLPKAWWGTDITFTSPLDPTLDAYKTKVRFQYSAADGIDYTIPTADLKGRKITLTFSGNTASLCFDDGTPVDTGVVSGTSLSLTITVIHPGRLDSATSTTGKTETKTYRKADGFAYTIIYGFSTSSRLIQKRYAQLKSYTDAGKLDGSNEVRTELLNIMGLTWLYQAELANRLLASRNGVLPLFQHRFGRMAQEEGFYVDVGLQLSGNWVDDGETSTGRYDNVFQLGSLYASAMEHGIIEQMQPGTSAVSTVNILRTANTAGQRLYLAKSANWSAIQGSLTGYSSQISSFTTLINGGAQLFLPQAANVTAGIWKGSGWVIRSPDYAGMIINGGYSGGYATSKANVQSPAITTNYSNNPASISTPSSVPVQSAAPAVSTQRNYAADPVDMASGEFVFAAEDMATGIEGAPRGLAFARNYSSNMASRDEQNLGYGWMHNFHIRAVARTASDEALGMGSPQQAAAFLAAVTAASDLYRKDATPKEWGVAALAVGWFVDQMKDNAVSVRMGKDIFQFIKQPDGTFTAPPGSTMILTKATDATYRLQQRLGSDQRPSIGDKSSSRTCEWRLPPRS